MSFISRGCNLSIARPRASLGLRACAARPEVLCAAPRDADDVDFHDNVTPWRLIFSVWRRDVIIAGQRHRKLRPRFDILFPPFIISNLPIFHHFFTGNGAVIKSLHALIINLVKTRVISNIQSAVPFASPLPDWPSKPTVPHREIGFRFLSWFDNKLPPKWEEEEGEVWEEGVGVAVLLVLYFSREQRACTRFRGVTSGYEIVISSCVKMQTLRSQVQPGATVLYRPNRWH